MCPNWWIEDLADEIRVMVNKALRKGESEEEFWETLLEEVTIQSESDWREVFHKEVPDILRQALEKAGLTCTLYYRKEDVPGFEYVANCVTKDGRKVALGFNVEYDPNAQEVRLILGVAYRGREWTPNQLLYYREV